MKVVKMYLISTPFYKIRKRFIWYSKISPSKFMESCFNLACRLHDFISICKFEIRIEYTYEKCKFRLE